MHEILDRCSITPQLAQWLMITFSVEATSLRELGLRDAQDREIFEMAKIEGTVIITKDSDFIELVTRFGTPPQILWITCGNVTNRNLKKLWITTFPQALELLQGGEKIVGISN